MSDAAFAEESLEQIQHLNFCWRWNSGLQQTANESEVQSNQIYDESHHDGDQERFF